MRRSFHFWPSAVKVKYIMEVSLLALSGTPWLFLFLLHVSAIFPGGSSGIKCVSQDVFTTVLKPLLFFQREVDLQIVTAGALEFSPDQAATQREYPREGAYDRNELFSHHCDEIGRFALVPALRMSWRSGLV